MKRWIAWIVLGAVGWCLLGRTEVVRADDGAKPAAAEEGSLGDQLKKNPNDLKLLNEFMTKSLMDVFASLPANPDDADKKIDAMQTILESLTPDSADAKQLLTRAKAAVPFYREQVALSRTTLAELEAKVTASPNDAQLATRYVRKLTDEVNRLTGSDPEAAEKALAAGRDFLKSIKAKGNEDLAKMVDLNDRRLQGLQRSIESAKRIAALVGKDAAALDVEAWVNGEALKDEDLKGKVVLLDFWAVWCGPCIATFPHLREWQEKYADKGLVIIGLTRYYNFDWDDAAGRSVQAKTPLKPEDEQQMLLKFAAHHKLQHRFAIQRKEGKLDEYYGVRGIPHAVVIDQEGKIRMIRVGSGEKNAKDIGGLLEELLEKK